MAVFRIERTRDYTVMSNHHLRNGKLSLKAKGLLSMMLSLPALAEQQKQLKATVFFTKDCGFFHALKLERSEVNGRFSH